MRTKGRAVLDDLKDQSCDIRALLATLVALLNDAYSLSPGHHQKLLNFANAQAKQNKSQAQLVSMLNQVLADVLFRTGGEEDFEALHAWMIAQRLNVPEGSGTAKALNYSLKRRPALTRYLDDGNLPADNN